MNEHRFITKHSAGFVINRVIYSHVGRKVIQRMKREEAIAILDLSKLTAVSGRKYEEAVDMAIEALQTERPTGVWDFNTNEDNGKSWNICSNCGHSQFHGTNYCPNCGAVMLVPIRHVELKKEFKIDDDYKRPPQILGNVEVVVRCKDCRYLEEYRKDAVPVGEVAVYRTMQGWRCMRFPTIYSFVEKEDFCSYGERKGGDTECL